MTNIGGFFDWFQDPELTEFWPKFPIGGVSKKVRIMIFTMVS